MHCWESLLGPPWRKEWHEWGHSLDRLQNHSGEQTYSHAPLRICFCYSLHVCILATLLQSLLSTTSTDTAYVNACLGHSASQEGNSPLPALLWSGWTWENWLPKPFLQAQFLLEEDVYDKRKLKWHLYVDKGWTVPFILMEAKPVLMGIRFYSYMGLYFHLRLWTI